jgi:hypothetical protein
VFLNSYLPLVFLWLAGPIVPKILNESDVYIMFLNCSEKFVSFGVSSNYTEAISVLADEAKAVGLHRSSNIKQ